MVLHGEGKGSWAFSLSCVEAVEVIEEVEGADAWRVQTLSVKRRQCSSRCASTTDVQAAIIAIDNAERSCPAASDDDRRWRRLS